MMRVSSATRLVLCASCGAMLGEYACEMCGGLVGGNVGWCRAGWGYVLEGSAVCGGAGGVGFMLRLCFCSWETRGRI